MILIEWFCYYKNITPSAQNGGTRKASRVMLTCLDKNNSSYTKVKENLCICLNASKNEMGIGWHTW